jgi:dinuclear metal center YbgI/SA1388 family protein
MIPLKLAHIIEVLEQWAPPSLQESYDNCGLLTGTPETEFTGAVICLDATEAVILEAASKGFNMVIAHHPIVFSGLKKLNGKNYIERAVLAAIRNQVAIYALHTNLDAVHNGVNRQIGDMLGITNPAILRPAKNQLLQLSTYIPLNAVESVRNALFDAGAGTIGKYSNCSFSVDGHGTFMASEGANPFVGEIGETHTEPEARIELVVPRWLKGRVEAALQSAHPYEVVALNWIALENVHQEIGSGMVGQLPESVQVMDFLQKLKRTFGGMVRHTRLLSDSIQRVAWCGGSGSFLLDDAIRQKADVFLTSDFKYHQFFDAEDKIVIVDIGHFENEQFTMKLIYEVLNKNFPNFAGCITQVHTNPIHYL